MSTNFPTSLDTFTNPAATDPMTGPGAVPHHSQHANLNDAVAALEAKVGINGSADNTSLDYKVSHFSGGSPGGLTGQVQYNSSGSFAGMAGSTVAASGNLLTIQAQATTDVPLTCKGITSQSGALQQWLNSLGNAVALILPDGTLALGPTASASTGVRLKSGDFNGELSVNAGQAGYFNGNNIAIQMPSNGKFAWTTNTTNNGSSGYDTALARPAAGVVAITNGSSGSGWLQNTAGRARLTANATNATATMSNLSDLSLTLIAGRKYTGRLVLVAKNSTAAEGLQFDFNGGTATMTNFLAGFAATPPGSGLALGTLTTTALGTALTATTATTSDAVYTIEISLVCNVGGTFIPRFAEVSHTSGTATVELGSNLWLEDSPN